MKMLRIPYWCAFVATGVVYGIMVFGTLPAISDGAAGLMPFDLRPLGYSTADAQLFLDNLSDEARAFYLKQQRILDTVFPALFGITLFGAFLVLIQNRRLRAALIILTLCAVVADYVENARVARMLVYEGVVPAAIVSAASQATVVKSVLNTIITVSFFVALGFWIRSKRRSR